MTRARMDEPSRLLIKSSARRAIAVMGGLKVAAVEVGLSDTQLSRLQSPHEPDLPLLETAILLDRACGEPLIIAAAREAIAPAPPAPLNAQDAGALAAQSGACVQSLISALDDGRVSVAEARVIQAQLATLKRTLAQAKRKIDHLAAVQP